MRSLRALLLLALVLGTFLCAVVSAPGGNDNHATAMHSADAQTGYLDAVLKQINSEADILKASIAVSKRDASSGESYLVEESKKRLRTLLMLAYQISQEDPDESDRPNTDADGCDPKG